MASWKWFPQDSTELGAFFWCSISFKKIIRRQLFDERVPRYRYYNVIPKLPSTQSRSKPQVASLSFDHGKPCSLLCTTPASFPTSRRPPYWMTCIMSDKHQTHRLDQKVPRLHGLASQRLKDRWDSDGESGNSWENIG